MTVVTEPNDLLMVAAAILVFALTMVLCGAVYVAVQHERCQRTKRNLWVQPRIRVTK